MKMSKIAWVLLGLLSGVIHAQVQDLGGPLSWKYDFGSFKNIPLIEMPPFDLASIQEEDVVNDAAKDRPWRFGYSFESSITPANAGEWIDVKQGRIWRVAVSSPGALTLNLLLEDFNLPQGAQLYLFDEQKTNRVGAYTAANNRPDGLLGTELVHGETMIIEYFEPHAVQGQGTFKIVNVIHGYRSVGIIQDQLIKALNSSGDCNIDVHCPLGIGWENQIRSVAMIVVSGSGICSGALINNSCNDGSPYFLTANHCLGGSTGNWAFRFNWASPPGTEDCATVANSVDPGPPYDQTANGATVLVNGTQADHALLNIDNLTIADAQAWELFYAGWNNDDTDGLITQATGIHHPSADVMKICREDNSPHHDNTSGAAVWWIDQWEQGVTEPGSSGSPLFDQNGRIIGQLYGGAAACSGIVNNGTYDYYGRLGVSWLLGIGDYLDPAGCGGSNVTNDGWDPNGPALPDNASIQMVLEPTGTLCQAGFNPLVRLRNAGGNDLTTCTIYFNLDGAGGWTYDWTGLLLPNESEVIQLPWVTASAGMHTFNAYSGEPNGVVDTNPANDASSSSFEVTLGGFETTVSISTDCWGYETYWELVNASSVLVASGGNTTGIPPGGLQSASAGDPGSYADETTVDVKLCLSEGCYSFTIYDDYGDGLAGNGSWGCTTDGSYEITNTSGTVLASITNVDFGDSETNTVCVVDNSGIHENTSSQLMLYPNPNSGDLTVELAQWDASYDVIITDLSGRNVLRSIVTNTSKVLDVSALKSGTYFISLLSTEGVVLTEQFIRN